MEREYSGTFSTTKHKAGKWRNVARWRPADGGGDWHQITHQTKVTCYPGENDNRGKRQAEAEGRAWFSALKADESRRAAQEAAEEQARNDGHDIKATSTVAEFCDYYLSECLPALKRLEPSTMTKYRRYWGYLSRDLGDFAIGKRGLNKLSRADVIKWVKGLAAQFSGVTVKESLWLLRTALDEAKNEGFIPANPAEGVTPPVKQARKRVTWIEPHELGRLAEFVDETLSTASPGSPQYCNALGVKIAWLTGLREGEVCALRWQDVDLGDEPSINVRHSIANAEDESGRGYTYMKEPKSERSIRKVPLRPELADTLKGYRDEVAAEIAAKLLPNPIDDLFIIGPVNEGTYKQPRYLSRAFRRMCKGLDLKTDTGARPHFHDLRHTFATICAHSGVIPEPVLCDIMGHANISTTHDYYVGVDEDGNREAFMKATGRLLPGGRAEILQFPATATA